MAKDRGRGRAREAERGREREHKNKINTSSGRFPTQVELNLSYLFLENKKNITGETSGMLHKRRH